MLFPPNHSCSDVSFIAGFMSRYTPEEPNFGTATCFAVLPFSGCYPVTTHGQQSAHHVKYPSADRQDFVHTFFDCIV